MVAGSNRNTLAVVLSVIEMDPFDVSPRTQKGEKNKDAIEHILKILPEDTSLPPKVRAIAKRFSIDTKKFPIGESLLSKEDPCPELQDLLARLQDKNESVFTEKEKKILHSHLHHIIIPVIQQNENYNAVAESLASPGDSTYSSEEKSEIKNFLAIPTPETSFDKLLEKLTRPDLSNFLREEKESLKEHLHADQTLFDKLPKNQDFLINFTYRTFLKECLEPFENMPKNFYEKLPEYIIDAGILDISFGHISNLPNRAWEKILEQEIFCVTDISPQARDNLIANWEKLTKCEKIPKAIETIFLYDKQARNILLTERPDLFLPKLVQNSALPSPEDLPHLDTAFQNSREQKYIDCIKTIENPDLQKLPNSLATLLADEEFVSKNKEIIRKFLMNKEEANPYITKKNIPVLERTGIIDFETCIKQEGMPECFWDWAATEIPNKRSFQILKPEETNAHLRNSCKQANIDEEFPEGLQVNLPLQNSLSVSLSEISLEGLQTPSFRRALLRFIDENAFYFTCKEQEDLNNILATVPDNEKYILCNIDPNTGSLNKQFLKNLAPKLSHEEKSTLKRQLIDFKKGKQDSLNSEQLLKIKIRNLELAISKSETNTEHVSDWINTTQKERDLRELTIDLLNESEPVEKKEKAKHVFEFLNGERNLCRTVWSLLPKSLESAILEAYQNQDASKINVPLLDEKLNKLIRD